MCYSKLRCVDVQSELIGPPVTPDGEYSPQYMALWVTVSTLMLPMHRIPRNCVTLRPVAHRYFRTSPAGVEHLPVKACSLLKQSVTVFSISLVSHTCLTLLPQALVHPWQIFKFGLSGEHEESWNTSKKVIPTHCPLNPPQASVVPCGPHWGWLCCSKATLEATGSAVWSMCRHM